MSVKQRRLGGIGGICVGVTVLHVSLLALDILLMFGRYAWEVVDACTVKQVRVRNKKWGKASAAPTNQHTFLVITAIMCRYIQDFAIYMGFMYRLCMCSLYVYNALYRFFLATSRPIYGTYY